MRYLIGYTFLTHSTKKQTEKQKICFFFSLIKKKETTTNTRKYKKKLKTKKQKTFYWILHLQKKYIWNLDHNYHTAILFINLKKNNRKPVVLSV